MCVSTFRWSDQIYMFKPIFMQAKLNKLVMNMKPKYFGYKEIQSFMFKTVYLNLKINNYFLGIQN